MTIFLAEENGHSGVEVQLAKHLTIFLTFQSSWMLKEWVADHLIQSGIRPAKKKKKTIISMNLNG